MELWYPPSLLVSSIVRSSIIITRTPCLRLDVSYLVRAREAPAAFYAAERMSDVNKGHIQPILKADCRTT